VSHIHGYDPETLREIVDPAECRERLAEIGLQRSLPALLERVWLLKVLGDLDEALTLSEQAVRLARMAGTRKDLLRARILHATVQQWRGAYGAAEHELSTCAEEAEGQGWAGIAAFALQHRGKTRYDAGDLNGARADFKRTLFLRQEAGASDAELEPTMQCIEAVDRHRQRTSLVS
jgi:tetratricopeptide (TPR) repeat protein